MNLIEKLKTKLTKYPNLLYEEQPGRLIIRRPEEYGFSITIIQKAEEITICFDNWHGHFDTEEEALDFVRFGLSDSCRLREFKRGGRPYKWVIEAKEANNWKPINITSSFCFRLWKKKEETIFQNHVLSGS